MAQTAKGAGELLPPFPFPLPPKRTRWPTVIGVISVLFALFPLLSLALSAVVLLGGGEDLLKQPHEIARQFEELPAWAAGVTVALYIYVFAMSLLLFVSGAALILRRRWGRTGHLVFAWIALGIFTAYAGTWVLSYAIYPHEDAAAFANTAWRAIGPWSRPHAYPLFVLVWFLRPRIKQQVRSW